MGTQIIKLLNSYGFDAWLCGGTARDIYLGIEPSGFDVAIRANLKELRAALTPKILKINQYDTSVTIKYKDREYCLYPLKKVKLQNTYYNYSFTNSLEDDAASKDFTINAIYFNPLKDEWIDFYDGIKDLNNKTIRFVGDPYQRILESKVRLLRCISLCSILGKSWKIDDASLKAVQDNKLKIAGSPSKQIFNEFKKVFTRCEAPSRFFSLMVKSRLDEELFTELSSCIGIEQSNKRKNLDLYQHIMYALDSVPLNHSNTLLLRTSALLHDIGKPATEVYTDTGMHFYNHENVGAFVAEKILMQWGYPSSTIETVVLLIKNHLFDASFRKSEASVKKLVAKVGENNIHNLLDLRMADRMGCGRPDISMKPVDILRSKVNKLLAKSSPDKIKIKLSNSQIESIIKKTTDNVDEAVGKVREYLEQKLVIGKLQNKPQNLRRAVYKINHIRCPLDKPHLFHTWSEKQKGNADIFPDGRLRCGVFCNFLCDNVEKSK
jgi:putative nucleotidyltransferase with HDIG domain